MILCFKRSENTLSIVGDLYLSLNKDWSVPKTCGVGVEGCQRKYGPSASKVSLEACHRVYFSVCLQRSSQRVSHHSPAKERLLCGASLPSLPCIRSICFGEELHFDRVLKVSNTLSTSMEMKLLSQQIERTHTVSAAISLQCWGLEDITSA